MTSAFSAAADVTGADLAIIGPGDDAAVLRIPDGRVVATTDMLIEGRHFRTEWSSAADIGHKAAARNLADVAAMGAVPTALLVGFAGPGRLAVDWVTELAEGIAGECAKVGARIIGGDTSSAELLLLAVTALGDLAGREPVTRSGARPGDLVAVAGSLGSAGAGLALLAAGATAGSVADGGDAQTGIGACTSSEAGALLAGLVDAHRRPRRPITPGRRPHCSAPLR